MFLVFTGNGKGKTTSALGQALRAIGTGQKALMVQFIKGPWKSGEDESYKRLAPDFKIVKMGKGFVGILGDKLPLSEHQQAAKEGLDFAISEAKTGNWQLLALDEVNNAIALKLLTVEEVDEALEEIKKHVETVIFTGRDAHQLFLDKADLVTEMKEIKHPYQQEVKAKKGVEY
jgi:cob(I)alamin adenosyltransferase